MVNGELAVTLRDSDAVQHEFTGDSRLEFIELIIKHHIDDD